MVFALLDGVTKYIKKKDINEDNFACKLVYSGTVAFLFVAAGLTVGNSLFGQPIKCKSTTGHSDLDVGFIENYCWIHGTDHMNDSITEKNIDQTCTRSINNKVST